VNVVKLNVLERHVHVHATLVIVARLCI